MKILELERERVLAIITNAEKQATPPAGYVGQIYNPVVLALRDVARKIMAVPPITPTEQTITEALSIIQSEMSAVLAGLGELRLAVDVGLIDTVKLLFSKCSEHTSKAIDILNVAYIRTR